MVSKFQQANQLVRSGKLEEAVAAYRTATQENAGFYGTYQNLGETLWKLGRLDEAIAAFRQVVELNSRSVWGLYQLGELLRQQKQFEEAVIYLRRAVEIKSDVGEFYMSLGAALVELGSLDEAVGYLRRAVELNPLPEAYYYLGVAQSQQQHWSEAVEYYRQGLEINPGDVDGCLGLAKALSQLGKWSEAVDSYRQVLTFSESGEVLFRLGQALGQLEQWEEAIAEYQRAINLGFAGGEVRHHLGYALSQLGRYEEAVVELRQVVEENPRSAQVRHQLGYALSQLQRWREAEVELRKAVELHPESASIWQHLEDVLQKLGKIDQIADQFYPDLKDKRIVVYTCNFGNYESVKEPLTIDPRVEYILFTDNKDLQSEKWKIVQISEFADSPRRASRLAKILSHQYLPEHDFSVYLDSSFTLIESDIYRMVQQCMEGSEIALYSHSERNCVYDEIDFCEKSEIRNVDSETCSKVRAKYKSINYPSSNGLFENGFIFRKNTSRVQRLNELWWSEYLEGSERDQFTLMYCLYRLDIKPHSIKIGRQMRKNPFVKWRKHKYKSYENYIDNSQFYIVYIEKFHNWGTTRLRGQQIYQRLLQKNLNIRMIPYSQAVHLHNKHMLFLKIHNYDVLLPVIQNSNKVYLDMVDCNSKYINPKKNIFKEVEFGIFTTKSSLDYYKNLFKHPEQCRTIYHHWDITLDQFKPASLNRIRIGYFGVKPKGFLYGEIPEIDFYEVTSTNFDDTLKGKMSSYNVQYIVRPIEEQKEFPALTKLSTASVFHAPVISSKTNEVELLGHDYPYYIDRLDRESVLKTIEKVKATFQKDEWNYAVNIMKSIKEKTSIDLIIKEYLDFFHSLSEIPSFYTNAESYQKVIYTANIGGYDQPIPLNPELSQGWDAYYFSDDPNFECSGWKHIYVDTEKVTRHSKVAYAREIKARPHLYFPNYDVTLWIDSNLSVERNLNDYLKNLPDDDFITTEHPKRRCIYEELQQPRVVVKIGKSVRDQVKQDLEAQGFPRKFGLQETRFILRKNTEKCRLIGEAWWNCMEKYHAYRDQLWLSYVLFKMETNIRCIDRKVRDNYFSIAEHSNLVTMRKKYALDFNSSDHAYVEIPHQKSLALTGDLTIECWIKLNKWPNTWTNIISKQLDDLNNEFCLRIKNAKVSHFYYGLDNHTVVLEWKPRSVMKLNSWTHVACVRKIGEFQKIYVDGSLVAEAIITNKGEATETDSPVLVMTNAKRNQFANAQMCDLRIWRKALSHYEILAQMNEDVQGNREDLVGYWKFDSGQGSRLKDSSLYHDGLIYGAIWKNLNSRLSDTSSQIHSYETNLKDSNISQKDRRRLFIREHIANLSDQNILEIGSLNDPTFVTNENRIYFADYLSQNELKKKYPHKSKKIHPVDFVIKVDKSYRDCIDKVFDLIVANHVIEHVPDIISWLNDLASITGDRGKLFLAVPDKKYTFDILRAETTLADILEAYYYQQKTPTYRSFLSYQYDYRNISSQAVWSGKDLSESLSKKKWTLTEAIKRTHNMVGNFHSIHCHVFTKNSFVKIFEELQNTKLLRWSLLEVQDVKFGGNEFIVLLQKKSE